MRRLLPARPAASILGGSILALAALVPATLILTSPGSAADLPARRAPAVVVPPPAFTWTGFYLGVNAGYGFDTHTNVNTFDGAGSAVGVAAGVRPPFVQLRPDGFIGGAQIGYNYQLADFLGGGAGAGAVIGVEADAAYASGRQTSDTVLAAGIDSFVHTRIDFLGTARGRLGYAIDRVMVYGTGGFAYADTRQASLFANGGLPLYAGGRSGFNTGYVYGGGVEYALPTSSFLNVFHSSAVTIKGEILHYQLGTRAYGVPATGLGAGGGTTGGYNQTASTNGNVVRVGLNFKFGAPAAVPVVARY